MTMEKEDESSYDDDDDDEALLTPSPRITTAWSSISESIGEGCPPMCDFPNLLQIILQSTSEQSDAKKS